MDKPELGTKCTCTGCHERFYDLNRSPAICPRCGVQQPPQKPRLRTFGAGSQQRQSPVAVTMDDDVELPGVAESDAKDDASEADDEADDSIDIDPDVATTDDQGL